MVPEPLSVDLGVGRGIVYTRVVGHGFHLILTQLLRVNIKGPPEVPFGHQRCFRCCSSHLNKPKMKH